MAQELILVGTVPDDGTGDPLRSAFTKSNANFTELYNRKPANTVVRVAANDSSANAKARADHLCDGTSDQVQIQAAIDSIAASGGVVLLEDGEFSTTGTINITTSNVALLGNGSGTIINPVWNVGSPLDKVISVQGELLNYIENVCIGNFSVVTDALYALTGSGGFIGTLWCRIWCQFVNNLKVGRIHGERVGFLADIRNCRDIVAQELTVFQAAGALASVYNDRMLLSNIRAHDARVVVDIAVCNDVQITNVQGTATTLGVTDFFVTGIDIGGCTDVTIADFSLDGFFYGISCKYEEARYHNVTIANGVITNHVAKGIHSDKNALATGVKLGPLNISNVRIKSTVANSQGVHLNGYSSDDSVSGCTIDVYGYGVIIEGSDNARVAGNRIVSTNSNAIYVGKINSTFESINARISDNIVSGGAGAAAIWVSQAVNPTIDNNHVITAGSHGIWALECKRPAVRGNRIDAVTTSHGIYVQYQSEIYLDTSGRTMRFNVDNNMIAGFPSRGVLIDMSGVSGAAYSVGSISRNNIFGDAANVGIALVGSVDFAHIHIKDNIIHNTLIPLYTVGAVMAATCRYEGNTGFLTEASGVATIASGTTSIVVSHGLGDSTYKALTPSGKDVTLAPTTNLGSATRVWVDTFTTTQMTIRVDANPGVDTPIGWQVRVLQGF